MRMYVCMYVCMDGYLCTREVGSPHWSLRTVAQRAHSSFNFRSIFHQKLACHLILLLLIDKIKRDLQLCTGQTAHFPLEGSVARVREREGERE